MITYAVHGTGGAVLVVEGGTAKLSVSILQMAGTILPIGINLASRSRSTTPTACFDICFYRPSRAYHVYTVPVLRTWSRILEGMRNSMMMIEASCCCW